jgi:hypothetical protein
MKVYFVHSYHLEDILLDEGCKVLVSYPYCRDRNKDDPDIPSGFSDVLIDSGAYQLQTGVAEVWLKGYALWLQFVLPKHPEVAAYMNLDIMGDPMKTLENQKYLESQGLYPLPVWHAPDDMDFLDYYCGNYEWVAVGGLVSTGTSKKAIDKLLTVITARHPETKFHIFGIGISGVVAYKHIRPYSIDFSTWSTVARFGHGIFQDSKQIIKEIALPADQRQLLRVDENFMRKMTREGVKNILMYERTLNELENTSKQMVLL